jgi:ketosteroid isomerase-like protein
MSAAGIGTDQVRAFLEAYAAAFQRQDKDAVADRYAYPAHVVTYDGGVALLPVPSREAWLAVIERILQMYRAMGVRHAAMVDLRVASVSPQIAQAPRRPTRWRDSTTSSRSFRSFRRTSSRNSSE